MHTFKRIGFLLFAVILIASSIVLNQPVIAAATDNDYLYYVESGEATITGYIGKDSKIKIPSKLGGYPVTAIGSNAFYYCESLTEVTIPNGVTSVGSWAFDFCKNLTSVSIPESITSFGSYVFASSNINLTKYDNALYAGNSKNPYLVLVSFVSQTAKSCTVHNKTKVIAEYAFSHSEELVSVTMGKNVEVIGDYAFYGAEKLKTVTLSDSVRTIGEMLFDYRFPPNFNIYEEARYLGTATNPYFALVGKTGSRQSLTQTSIEIHEDTKIIGPEGLSGSYSLENVHIPSGVQYIDSSAFVRCRSLTKISVAPGNRYYSNDKNGVLFNKNKTTLVYIPNGITGSYTVPEGVTTFAPHTLEEGFLQEVTLPSTLTAIGEFSFTNCNLAAIWANKNNRYYSSDGQGMLFDKAQTTLLCLPPNFSGTYTLPATVTQIEDNALAGCQGQTYNVYGNARYFGKGDNPYFALIKPVSDDITSCVIPNKTEIIFHGAFWGCDELTTVTIGSGITAISNGTFYACKKLETVKGGKNVTTIGTEAFWHCESLTKLPVGKYVTSIGSGAFAHCYSLTEITIGKSIRDLGSGAFSACSGLTSVTIEPGVERIGPSLLGGSNKLKNPVFTGTREQWAKVILGANNQGLIPNGILFADEIPSAPTNVKAQVTGNGQVKITWTAAERATHHVVRYRKAGTESFSFVTCVQDTTCTVSDLELNTAYEFYVEAYQLVPDQGAFYGPASPVISVTTTLKVAAPTGLKVTLVGHDDVKLTWKAAKGANRYYVHYRKKGAKSYKRAAITSKTSYTIKDLADNTAYEFRVYSYFDGYKGKPSAAVAFSTTRNLSAPKKVTVQLYGYDDAKITWSKVKYATAYRVYYKRSGQASYKYIGQYTGTSAKKANLYDGYKYTFKVVPVISVNGGYYKDDSSKSASVTTLKKVSEPKVKKYSSSKVKVSWTDISGESGYQIGVYSDKACTKKVSITTATGKDKTLSVKKGKTYYYKVRAYKTVDGKRFYAPWSAVQSFKLK